MVITDMVNTAALHEKSYGLLVLSLYLFRCTMLRLCLCRKLTHMCVYAVTQTKVEHTRSFQFMGRIQMCTRPLIHSSSLLICSQGLIIIATMEFNSELQRTIALFRLVAF